MTEHRGGPGEEEQRHGGFYLLKDRMEVGDWHELEVLFWRGGTRMGKGMGVGLASRRGLMEPFWPCMCVCVSESKCVCVCVHMERLYVEAGMIYVMGVGGECAGGLSWPGCFCVGWGVCVYGCLYIWGGAMGSIVIVLYLAQNTSFVGPSYATVERWKSFMPLVHSPCRQHTE